MSSLPPVVGQTKRRIQPKRRLYFTRITGLRFEVSHFLSILRSVNKQLVLSQCKQKIQSQFVILFSSPIKFTLDIAKACARLFFYTVSARDRVKGRGLIPFLTNAGVAGWHANNVGVWLQFGCE